MEQKSFGTKKISGQKYLILESYGPTKLPSPSLNFKNLNPKECWVKTRKTSGKVWSKSDELTAEIVPTLNLCWVDGGVQSVFRVTPI